MDADDTLFDFGAAQKVAFFEAFNELKYPVNEETYKRYDRINLSHWKKLERGETTKERLVFERFEDLFQEIGFNGDAQKAEEKYQARLGEQCFWLDGAKSGVEKLSKKYDIYIITNGHAETQFKRIERSGLISFVKGVFVSESVGYNKPDPRFYDVCFARCGADREKTLCIGDSLTSDIKGAIDSGLHSMWCNFFNVPTPPAPIDYIVCSWEEVLRILL